MSRSGGILFLAVLCFSVWAAGCDGGRDANEQANAGNINRPSSGTSARGNQTIDPTTNASSNGQPTNNVVANPRNRRIEAMRNAGMDPNGPKPDVESILQKSTRPAPENSEFSVALTDTLIERRVFLNHPVLAKVEKITAGQKSTIAVFTKDGRKIDLPGDAVQSLSTAPSSTIVSAAGISQSTRAVSSK